jgi:hypothetical protein
MADAKHTPGPLTVQRAAGAGREGEVGILSDGRYVVAECWADIRYKGEQALDEAMANATLYAAASELLEALQWRERFEPLAGEGSNERFERIADIFFRETGHLRPGKDCCVESIQVRQQAWDEWMDVGRARARAAIAKATGGAS